MLDGGHINPKIFQLDSYKKCLLMVLLKLHEGCTKKELKVHTIPEISQYLTAQKVPADSKELVRMLYILEGWELCCPVPETKLTSQKWRLTQKGFEMVTGIIKNLESNLNQVF